MRNNSLNAIAKALVAEGKGILAADDDAPEMSQRFKSMGNPSEDYQLHDYWTMLFSTPGINKFLSGVILCDEAARLSASSGGRFVELLTNQGIIPGINVAIGTRPFTNTSAEVITIGLDRLPDQLKQYSDLGLRFTKWQAMIAVGDGIPSPGCINENAFELARFAYLSQQAGLLPIVEPDVQMSGDHSIERCQQITENTLNAVFEALARCGVVLEEMILKPNMVLPGRDCKVRSSVAEVAQATVTTLRKCVPPAVPGIAFLSGGQSDHLATAHLNAMNAMSEDHDWSLTFCFGRALQTRALKSWCDEPTDTTSAMAALYRRASLNGAASRGKYTADMELDAPIEQLESA
jgi:fructose-bisphosphate aldolase class I